MLPTNAQSVGHRLPESGAHGEQHIICLSRFSCNQYFNLICKNGALAGSRRCRNKYSCCREQVWTHVRRNPWWVPSVLVDDSYNTLSFFMLSLYIQWHLYSDSDYGMYFLAQILPVKISLDPYVLSDFKPNKNLLWLFWCSLRCTVLSLN